jgi:hypothetical protein
MVGPAMDMMVRSEVPIALSAHQRPHRPQAAGWMGASVSPPDGPLGKRTVRKVPRLPGAALTPPNTIAYGYQFKILGLPRPRALRKVNMRPTLQQSRLKGEVPHLRAQLIHPVPPTHGRSASVSLILSSGRRNHR